MTVLEAARVAPPSSPAAPQQLRVLASAMVTAMGFLLLAAQSMPAGLLPEVADGLGISEAVVEPFTSLWALAIVTITAISLARGFRRKPLLLAAIAALLSAAARSAPTLLRRFSKRKDWRLEATPPTCITAPSSLRPPWSSARSKS